MNLYVATVPKTKMPILWINKCKGVTSMVLHFRLVPVFMFHTLFYNWKTFSNSKTLMPPTVMYNQTEWLSPCIRKLGWAHPSHSFVHPLYHAIYLQTNGFYAGDQKLWAYFSIQLAKLFLTISNLSLRLHKVSI